MTITLPRRQRSYVDQKKTKKQSPAQPSTTKCPETLLRCKFCRPLGVCSVREFSAVKYRVFLSYCQRDKALGRWLQGELESYRIAEDFVGRPTPAGAVPRTLQPIFRSREEGGDTLTEQTSAALQAAQFLVVLCSPDAAKSQHINELI